MKTISLNDPFTLLDFAALHGLSVIIALGLAFAVAFILAEKG